MLSIGSFYQGKTISNKYKCLNIEDGKVTLSVHIELPPEKQFIAIRNNGEKELIKTFNATFTQDLKYSNQYQLITDPLEIDRLTKIFNAQQKTPPDLSLTSMPIYLLWRTAYRQRRYMEYKDDDYVYQRLADIFNNFLTLNEEGQIKPIELNIGKYWIRRFTETHEELVLRNAWPPKKSLKNILAPPTPTWPNQPNGWNKDLEEQSKKGNLLFKYGSHCYLQPMLETGKIRIAPATIYNDSSLNPAIRDEELKLIVEYHPSDIKLEHYDSKNKKIMQIHPTSNLIKTIESSTNYYVYCISKTYEARLYEDFEADSCLVIKDADRFINSVATAFFEQVSRQWNCSSGLVKYIDPLLCPIEDIDIFFSKHFRYWYQSEYRMIWLPPKAEKEIHPVFIEIGDMRDYCELVTLKNI